MLAFVRALTVLVLLFPAAALAQKCTEQFVREIGDKPNGTPAEQKAQDVYFFAPFLPKPVIGVQQWKDAAETKMPKRKNHSPGTMTVDRVVVSPDADMAYAYGTAGGSDDEAGKHQELTIAYLEVWRVVDGSCKLAARMVQPEGDQR